MASRHEIRARHTEKKQRQNPQELFKRNMAVAALVGVTAAAAIGVFAGTYYIDNGDITIEGDQITYYEDDKTTQKTETDNDITITQHEDVEVTDNTITIIADENETVEVTIKDINIEATEKIDPDAETTKDNYEAAISIEGAGDVVLELEGDNVVKSGDYHAGVETAGSGMLTIEDEDHDGSLDATGGKQGAGIGGGYYGDGNVTINGGIVTATGGMFGAGIGGGMDGDGKVMITGGTVTATSGCQGVDDLENANAIGAGGYKGYDSGESELQSTVVYDGGTIIEQPYGWDAKGHTHVWAVSEYTAPTYEAKGAEISLCECGSKKTEFLPALTPDEQMPNGQMSLTTTTLSGTAQPYEQTMADGRAVFAAPAQDAILTGSLGALAELKAQGATMLVFRTWQCETSVSMDKLLAAGSEDDVFALTHKGAEAVLTVDGRVIK